MTYTQLRALLWEQARRTGPAVALCALLGTLLPAFIELTATPESKIFWAVSPSRISTLAVLFAVFFQGAAGLILLVAYGTANNLSMTVPTYALRLPVQTLPLLVTRFSYAVIVFIAVAIMIWGTLNAFDNEIAVLTAVQLTGVLFIGTLSLGWLAGALPSSYISTALLASAPVLLVMFILTRTDFEEALLFLMVAVIPVLVLLGFIGAACQRRGDELGDIEIIQDINALGERSRGLNFDTPDEAQRWFERRQLGHRFLFLTLFIGMTGTVLLFVDYGEKLLSGGSASAAWDQTLSGQRLFERILLVGNAWAIAIPIAAVITGGLWFVIVSRTQWGQGASFYFNRPLSTERLTRARIQAMLTVLATTTLIVLPFSAIAFSIYAASVDGYYAFRYYTVVAACAAATGILLAWSALWIHNIAIVALAILAAVFVEGILGGDEDVLIPLAGFGLATAYAWLHWKRVGNKRIVPHLAIAAVIILNVALVLSVGFNYGDPGEINNLRLDHVDFLIGLAVGLFCLAPIVSTNYELPKARHR